MKLDRELRGERHRRFGTRVDAWKEEIAAWEAEFARVKTQSSITAYFWMTDHPRPAYHTYYSIEA